MLAYWIQKRGATGRSWALRCRLASWRYWETAGPCGVSNQLTSRLAAAVTRCSRTCNWGGNLPTRQAACGFCDYPGELAVGSPAPEMPHFWSEFRSLKWSPVTTVPSAESVLCSLPARVSAARRVRTPLSMDCSSRPIAVATRRPGYRPRERIRLRCGLSGRR
jgi:hypothetical protein